MSLQTGPLYRIRMYIEHIHTYTHAHAQAKNVQENHNSALLRKNTDEFCQVPNLRETAYSLDLSCACQYDSLPNDLNLISHS